jgi:ferredoxin
MGDDLMRALILPKDAISTWCMKMKEAGMCLVLPRESDGMVVFEEATDDAPLELPANYTKSKLSPKSHLFPPTEALFGFRFEQDEVELEDVELDTRRKVLFAVRPCDVAGMIALSKVFLEEPYDPYFGARFERAVFIALACESVTPSCFCTAVGYSPFWDEGVDVLICDVDDAYLLRVMTDKGEECVSLAQELFSDADESHIAIAERKRMEVESKLPQRGELVGVAEKLIASFESEFWEKLCRKCASCGACTYVCPSCSCFDVTDEWNPFGGCRYRSWDGCCFAMFTMHASGHNPRPTQAHRYRQRLLHKLAYFPLRYGMNMCVGCGRCIDVCPVGMDIYEIAKAVLEL